VEFVACDHPLHFDQLHHPQGFNTLVEAFREGRNTNQLEPSEQHKNALGKEGARKPEVTLMKSYTGQHNKLSDGKQIKWRDIAAESMR
jgi:hypothetical protein